MSRKWIVLGTVAAVVLAFVAGVVVFTNRSSQEVKQAAQTHSDALVRPHSPVFGNPAAKVTIVEFFDPSCEACRAFHPYVKQILAAPTSPTAGEGVMKGEMLAEPVKIITARREPG